MQIVNLTPHTINLHTKGAELEIESSGIARVDEAITSEGSLCFGGANVVPIVSKTFGNVTGVPDPVEGVIYVVSAIVLSACDRSDVYAPDTGSTAVREEGRIVAVTRLVK